MKREDEYLSEKEISLEILKELREIKRKLPDGNKPKASDLGVMANEDFCEAMKISRWTAAALRKSGKLRYSKFGGRIVYLISDIIDMIRENFQRS